MTIKVEVNMNNKLVLSTILFILTCVLQVIAETLSAEELAGLKEMFKMIDADNSGRFTFEELKAGLKRVAANLNESENYDLMQALSIRSFAVFGRFS